MGHSAADALLLAGLRCECVEIGRDITNHAEQQQETET
jgi:hypothetical protein